MSIEIDFRLTPSWNSRTRQVDLASAGEEVLRYEAFLGDVILRIDGIDFSAQWGWVPVLDFAMGMENVLADLLDKGRSVFEFTESANELRFAKEGDVIHVSGTYVNGQASMRLEEFQSAVSRFSERVRDRLCREWPELRTNKAIERWNEATEAK